MHEDRLSSKSARGRWTVAFGLILSLALVLAALGARPVNGHEEVERSLAEPAAHMYLVIGSRSVGEFFPAR